MSKNDSAQGFQAGSNFLNLATRSSPGDISKNFANQENIPALYKKAKDLYFENNYKECASVINEIYKSDSGHAGAMELQAMIAMKQMHFETAEILFRQLSEKLPENADIKIALGHICLQQSRFIESKEFFEKAIELCGNDLELARAKLGLSKAAMSTGEIDIARNSIKSAHELNPQDSEILYIFIIFLAKKDDVSEKLIKHVKTLIESSTEDKDLILLHFALSRLHKLAGQEDESFQALKVGCDFKRKTLNYDPKKTSQHIEDTINYFSKDFILNAGLAGVNSQRPVFIVAMPRSGTTLLEQILTTHEEIGSIGEDPMLNKFIATTSYLPERNGIAYPLRDNPQKGNYLTCEALAHQYHNYLLFMKGPEFKRIIHKGLGTRLLVGLLYMMFPNARFIHVRRNPVDCLMSCYNTNFNRDTQPYSYDLEELGLYYQDHLKLMKHWESILPEKNWITVDYEELVQNQESESKRIFEFLDIEWDESCLSSEKSQNHVSTASAAQVREAVHTKAIGKWEIWKDHITPLLETLKNGQAGG